MINLQALNVPDDPKEMPAFLRRLQTALIQAMNRPEAWTQREVLHAEPPGKLEDGMEVEADGTNWDPGSGAGKYVLRGGVWVFIG